MGSATDFILDNQTILWNYILTPLIIIIILFNVLLLSVKIWTKSIYEHWKKHTYKSHLDVDSFVDTETTPPNHPKIVFLHKLASSGQKPHHEPIQLNAYGSPYVPGLLLTQNSTPRPSSSKKHISQQDGAIPLSINNTDKTKKPSIVIGTIRMGFGHHRIAYAAASWSLSSPHVDRTYFHDLLNIDSPEADLIQSTDAMYSKMSRWTSNLGGIFEALWGKATLSGDGDSLRVTGLMAVQIRVLLMGLDRDTPIIASHSLVALTAVACGFRNVINLVIDNHAQWFVLSPGCINLVQGPVNYQSFLRMGVPPANIRLAGHWIPENLVTNIPSDCHNRIQRAQSGFLDNKNKKKSRRILIPVGGAGAQRRFIVKLIKALSPMVKSGDVSLFLNAGDHKHMKTAFESALSQSDLTDYQTITTIEGVNSFQKHLLVSPDNEPSKPITLFTFPNYFPAVATTDILCRVSDILACKPSELAFYPVPKLMIRRVGDHEQFSARRAAELGDGTLEARTVDLALGHLKVMCGGSELLGDMNSCIVRNAREGVYDGCKRAVEIALENAERIRNGGVGVKDGKEKSS